MGISSICFFKERANSSKNKKRFWLFKATGPGLISQFPVWTMNRWVSDNAVFLHIENMLTHNQWLVMAKPKLPKQNTGGKCPKGLLSLVTMSLLLKRPQESRGPGARVTLNTDTDPSLLRKLKGQSSTIPLCSPLSCNKLISIPWEICLQFLKMWVLFWATDWDSGRRGNWMKFTTQSPLYCFLSVALEACVCVAAAEMKMDDRASKGHNG